MATFNNKIIDLATEVTNEIQGDNLPSISAIAYYFTTNIGGLNNLLGTSFTVDPDKNYEFNEDLDDKQKYIFKLMYLNHFYNRMVQINTGAAAFNAVVMVSSDGAQVRRTERTNVAQIYLSLKKNVMDELKQQVSAYKISSSTPLQVTGDDIFSPQPFHYERGTSRQGESNAV